MYGRLDGNPLSLDQLQSIDPSVTQEEINELVNIGILKPENYLFKKCGAVCVDMSEAERAIIGLSVDGFLNIDDVKNNRDVRTMKINAKAALQDLCDKEILKCVETRYDFKNTKISTGLHGVSRIFLPSSKTYPTLVASDTNDFITPVNIDANSEKEFKERFITEIYNTGKYRRINKREACRIQGFPENYLLPENRTRWMKLIGNSVAVPVISKIVNAIMETGVFNECNNRIRKPNNKRLSFPSINGVERV